MKKGGKGREWKHGEPSTSEQAREMNWPQKPNCKTQKAPVATPRPPRKPATWKTADPHCLEFNLA